MDAQSPIREELMRKALELAARGRGWVEPNPMVGCVIEREGRIVGEGWHKRFGGPHAEREALNAYGSSPAGATAYVTLEPCCHVEKKTPPCVPALIEAKLARVVVACADPNPEVAGKGIEQLRAAGIDVHTGVLENSARQLNAAFFNRMLHDRPYVTLKWAQTADGKLAGPGGKRIQISNEQSMRAMHELRGKCDAIVVGIGTVLNDDPMLTARLSYPRPGTPGRGQGEGSEGCASAHVAEISTCAEAHPTARVPLRVVLDSSLRIPIESKLVKTAREAPVRVHCSRSADPGRAQTLRDAGVEVRPSPRPSPGVPGAGEGGVPLEAVVADLYASGATHVLVEPGPTLAQAFLLQNLPDRVWVFHSSKRVDAADAPDAPAIDWPISAEIQLDGDRLVERLNPRSPVFYELLPSADFPR